MYTKIYEMANTCNGRRPGLGWSGLGDRVETVDDMPVTAGLFAIQKLARQTLHKIINTI